MKSLYQIATGRYKPKYDVQNHPAKVWANIYIKDVLFVRSDGSLSVDKTRIGASRPHKKEELRNANRSITKRARQILKRQLQYELEE